MKRTHSEKRGLARAFQRACTRCSRSRTFTTIRIATILLLPLLVWPGCRRHEKHVDGEPLAPLHKPVPISAAEFDPERIKTLENGARIVSNQVLASFKRGVTQNQIDEFLDKYGLRTGGRNRVLGVYQLEILDGIDPVELCEKLTGHPYVAAISPNLIFELSALPAEMNESLNAVKRAWLNYGELNANYYEFVNTHAFDGWDISRGARGVTIAVVDTGIYNPDVPDAAGAAVYGTVRREFSDKLEPGYDFVDDDDTPYVNADDTWHGTAMAAIAGARGDNAGSSFGVCWGCGIMPVRAATREGGSLYALSAGIAFAAENDAKIILTGLSQKAGVLRYSMEQGDWLWALRRAVTHATRKRGCLVVAPAGNSGGDAGALAPASIGGVLAVGAVDNTDARLPASSHGRAVVIAAPGAELTAIAPSPGKIQGYCSGTSCAAAFTAGIAGLVWSLAPDQLRAEVVREIILKTADKIKSDETLGTACLTQADRAAGYNGCRANVWRALLEATGRGGLKTRVSFEKKYTIFDDVTVTLEEAGIRYRAKSYTREDTYADFTASIPPGKYKLAVTKAGKKIHAASVSVEPGQIAFIKVTSDFTYPEVKRSPLPEKTEQQLQQAVAAAVQTEPETALVNADAMDVLTRILAASSKNDFQTLAALIDFEWLYDLYKERKPDIISEKNVETFDDFKRFTVDSGIFVTLSQNLAAAHQKIQALTDDPTDIESLKNAMRVDDQGSVVFAYSKATGEKIISLHINGESWKIFFPELEI